MSQQYVQKYVIVHFIDVEKTPIDFSASEWPLHITLLANFQTKDINSFRSRIEDFSKRHTTFTVHADGEALFGSQQTIRVSLIEPNDAILAMHNNLLSTAIGQGAVLDEPRFVGTGYRPHATIQVNDRLQNQQEVNIDSLSLVDMFPGQDHMRRKIIQTYSLRD